jgi:hypothetical protein
LYWLDLLSLPLRRTLADDIYRRYFEANLMESVSLKLPEKLLETSERCARALGISRAEYIHRAIERMNRETSEAPIRAEQMPRASRKVRKESMQVNAEFAAIERDPEGRTFKALLASVPLDGVEIRRSRDTARPRL